MVTTTLKKKYGPWAIVTGASSGIGAAFAIELAQQGFNLLLVARRQEELDKVAARARQISGVEAETIVSDLSTKEGVDRVSVASKQKDIGLLVASAGFGTSGPLLDSDPETELQMLSVNCSATMLLAHELGNRMKVRGKGGIILLSSLLAWQGVPRAAHYAATKAYVQALAEGMARELKPFGIDVLSCAPGPVFSGFGERARMNMTIGVTPDAVAAQSIQALGHQTTVVPGMLSKVLTSLLAPLPRWLRIRIMEQIMLGMTRNGINTT